MTCPDYFCQEHRECLCRENGLPEFAESTIVMFDTEEARGRMSELSLLDPWSGEADFHNSQGSNS